MFLTHDLYDTAVHCGNFCPFHAVLIYVLPLLLAVQYRERMTLWITYVVNDVTMAVSMVTGFYHGICDLNMLLGSNHSRDWYMEQWMAGTLHFGIEPDPVFVILFYGALPRAVILLISPLFCGISALPATRMHRGSLI